MIAGSGSGAGWERQWAIRFLEAVGIKVDPMPLERTRTKIRTQQRLCTKPVHVAR